VPVDGDEALVDLYLHYRKRIHDLCCRLVRPDAAEDLAQEAFLRAWKYRASFDGRSQPTTWLYSIARNVCRDAVRREIRDRDMIWQAGMAMANQPAAPSPVVDDLRLAVAALPRDMREVLVLVKFHGLSYREAAQVCDCTEVAARQRLHRAMRRLEAALRPEGEHDDM
jgi:RNA polymerase sigma-70 factor (ECF subfamily)